MNDFIISTNVETLSPKVEVLMLKGEPGSGGGSSDYVTKEGLLQTTGIATDNTMSQNAITGALALKQGTLTAGSNITINNNEISATDTTYSNATTSSAGLMSANDKEKLEGISSGAEVNVQANWNETDTSSDAYIQNKPNISSKEDTSNKVTSLSSSSTDTQYPSAKCVYDLIGDINTILATLTTPVGGSV